ncbi:DUF11 domain-containing protein [Micromonospora purpureochromogenes]|uniref:DUF11 domain-containing protein n=1 Tax=Micromonospora purpureochromogenes TaxID=47872 RepID=UPI000B5AC945|nr:DUF11 domain-containing protein [Micromonospora purpureochromogenes]
MPAGPALAGPAPRPDLTLDLVPLTTVAKIESSRVTVAVRADVANAGAAVAEDAKIAFKLPAGSAIVGDPSWQCDYATFVCTNIYGPVPAGGVAEPLRIYFSLPPAPAGTVATIGATVSTNAREAATNNNTDQLKTTYAEVADLQLLPGPDTGVWWQTDVPLEGGPVNPTFTAKNVGTATAQDLRLVVDLPAGVTVDGAPVNDAGAWDCVTGTDQVICTAGPLEPNAAASVTLALRTGPGAADQQFAIPGTLTSSSRVWRVEPARTEVTYRYAGPVPVAPADIAVTNVVLLEEEVGPGEAVEIGVVVENLADDPARDVRVRLALAPTVRPTEGGASGTDWACEPGQDAETGAGYWECTYASVERYQYHYLPLSVTFGAGTPQGQFVATATVQSANDDLNPANNSRQAVTSYRPQGTIEGTVWYDEDRDGQRDAGEPLGGYGEATYNVEFLPEGAATTELRAYPYVGAYARAVPPGRYVVRVNLRYGWQVTTPNVGDDATDSDVTSVPTAPYNAPYADSTVIEVTDGGTVVVDVGVIPAP